jgi:hypothetical protein
MEKTAGRSAGYLRRDEGGNAQTNVARTSDDCAGTGFRVPDLGAIVECLVAAHYSEHEILDYLTGPLGCSDETAAAALAAGRY